MGTNSKGDPVITPEMKSRYHELGFWGRGTFLAHLTQHARTRPDETFIWDRENTYTFSDIQDKVEALAQHLLQLGIGKGSRVAVQVPNWVQFFILHFAAEKIGAIIVSLTPNLRAHELEFILRKSRCVSFVSPRFYRGVDYPAMIEGIRPKCQSLIHQFFIDEDRSPRPDSFDRLLERGKGIGFQPPNLQSIKDDDIYSLKITSGTTAMPKVFMYTENGYVAAAYNVVEALDLSEKDRVAAIAPITQGLGQLVGFGAAIVAGCGVVLIPHFNPVEVLQIIERERATVGVAVPTALSKMISVPDFGTYDFRSLRAFQLGGALLHAALAKRIEEAFGCTVINTYGSSEGPIPFSTRFDDPEEIRHNTVGHLLPGHEVKIVDSMGNPLPPGGVGEIVSRGPSTSAGYLDDPEANAKAFAENGWFRHGDLGSIDERGIARIVGRKKEIIIRGGQNISPKEIEEVLILMPKIAEVAIIGLPDPVYGERVCACVVPKDSKEIVTLKEITSFLRGKGLAPFKLPERLQIVKSLPHSAGEKIRKDLLAREILEGAQR